MFVPDKVNVPAPALVRAPEVLFPELPEIVNVFVVTSIVLVVEAVRENALSVVAVAPVYLRVPPPNTRLVTAFVA